MGKLERKSKKQRQRKNLEHFILRSVQIAGVLSIGLVAPNVIGAMQKLGLMPSLRQREYVASSASKLAKRGLLAYDGKSYILTSNGEDRLRYWEFADFHLEKPRKWDKKWRVIIFDIPEKK